MKTIDVSVDVFAAIWRLRQAGEENEDQILKRILFSIDRDSSIDNPSEEVDLQESLRDEATRRSGSFREKGSGVHDARNDVYFPHGMVIVRQYKGRSYRAEVVDGRWLRQDNGQTYASVNQLNESIARSKENIWNGAWRFIGEDGGEHVLAVLRKR